MSDEPRDDSNVIDLHKPGREKNETPRGSDGRWVRGIESVERDVEALRLRSQGWSLRHISEVLGYGGEGNVHRALERARTEVIRPAAQELVDQELASLDHLIDTTLAVLSRNHVVVSHGRIIRMGLPPGEGEADEREPLIDDGPILQAVATLQRLYESRRKLMGTDAAIKVDATVHETTQADLELDELVREAKAKQANEQTLEAR